MPTLHPWITCLQSGMLIRHLETRYPDQAAAIDYLRIMEPAESLQEIGVAKTFLSDPSNWIPLPVFRELIKACELASGDKDFTYHAALAYYEQAKTGTPTFLETIVLLLNDVESVFRPIGNWASAYTNYLQLQSFTCPGESHMLHILSRYVPPVEPVFGNLRLVLGNFEGIAKLDPSIDTVICEELYSQLRLETLVNEFGDAYSITVKGDRITVIRRSTGETILTGRTISLAETATLIKQDPHALVEPPEEQLIVKPDAGGTLPLWTVLKSPHKHETQAAERKLASTAIQIERGGILMQGPLRTVVKTGAIYNAPYTHYRLHWNTKPHRENEPATGARTTSIPDRRAFAGLLFSHLKNLQTTHRHTLTMLLRTVELAQENVQLRQELSAQQEPGGIVGKSAPLQELLSLIHTVAPSDTTVLITGETGTGKELAARLIHRLSRRKDRRFVAVNCGAIPEALLESELFGHEKGSFTGAVAQKKGKFELAEGGTLFLDEIGDISPAMQVKLLRVLQEREFQRVGGTSDLKANVRLIAATHRDLTSLMEENQFRSDLFYRLNVIQLYVPALRERTEDIPELTNHFAQSFAHKMEKPIAGLTPEALKLCLAYKWPGNIRELENVMERAVTLTPEGRKWITPDLLPPVLRSTTQPTPSIDLAEFVDRIDWSTMLQSLETRGSLTGLLNDLEWAITR
ncbi:MAG: sigma 54-interacting transcriptional regulator, partial [Nitrospira sp.]|nr:sigma 54-interacting transcriptional regulator [Nitrospira sp.]